MKPEEFLTEKDIKFRKRLLITSENIEAHLTRYTVEYFDTSMLLNKAGSKLEESKTELQKTESHVYSNLKLKFAERDQKVTETELKLRVKIHSIYTQALDNHNEIKDVYDTLKVKLDTLKTKLDVLKLMQKNIEHRTYISSIKKGAKSNEI